MDLKTTYYFDMLLSATGRYYVGKLRKLWQYASMPDTFCDFAMLCDQKSVRPGLFILQTTKSLRQALFIVVDSFFQHSSTMGCIMAVASARFCSPIWCPKRANAEAVQKVQPLATFPSETTCDELGKEDCAGRGSAVSSAFLRETCLQTEALFAW